MRSQFDFTSPYLTKQIIAYIGNKRKLLPLIYKAVESTGLLTGSVVTDTPAAPVASKNNSSKTKTSATNIQPLTFLDVFAGSGVVSRFAKAMGFEVYTNDWEPYAEVISKGFVEANDADIEKLFGSKEKFCALLEEINSLPDPAPDEQYVAKYYAPASRDIDDVNYKTERLFYTRQNALNIDKIRNEIEKRFPATSKDKKTQQKRNILLAELLYEAATHTNTSGVFKACHKGFGGHNKDALKRILSPIFLNEPVLINSPNQVHVFREDANVLVQKKALQHIDIAYLDPPYNQHQYGSNYHMLNTIAKWDHIPEPLELNEKGELKEKAAIRHDWVNTRSPYCYKQSAEESFRNLITNINAKYILISYSTDGIIPFEDMQQICAAKGKVSIVTNEYTKYRGGKQSNSRLNTNIEFILCIDTQHASSKESISQMDSILMRKKYLLLFKQKFVSAKIKKAATSVTKDGTLSFTVHKKNIVIQSDDCFTLYPPEDSDTLSVSELQTLYETLKPCICETKEEELSELIEKARKDNVESISFAKKIPDTLKKLASKKNRKSFEKWIKEVKVLKKTAPETYKSIEPKINKLEEIAALRFNT